MSEALAAARAAGLRYVNDGEPGINRQRHGRGYIYRDARSARVTDRATLRRIRALAVPPAWMDVWICPSAEGHIQATGRDARRRKQYRYHPLWRQLRDELKYGRAVAFAEALPRLRQRVAADLARQGLPRDKVIATVVALLEKTLLRVGNEEYARQNRSYGLTTLRNRHVRVGSERLRLSYRGKGGRPVAVGVRSRRLARVIRQCQDLPGQRLFQYLDQDGRPQSIDSDDVNEYLREAMGGDFSAKDFRTWAATVLAARSLREQDDRNGHEPAQRRLKRAIERVARTLGNTPAICRTSYVHPQVIDAYVNGSLSALLEGPTLREGPTGLEEPLVDTPRSLADDERAVLSFLRRSHAPTTGMSSHGLIQSAHGALIAKA